VVGTLVYECTTGAASGWCTLEAYKPGTGTAWEQAWTLKGSCIGTIAPTTLSPTTLAPTAVAWSGVGCPFAYVAGTAYVEGSTVAVGTMVYQCKVPGWCTLETYKPGTGTAWEQAWTLKGSCTGTIAPTTLSPTTLAPAAVAWSGVGCPIAYVVGTAYVEGSTVAVGTMVYQCKIPGWCTREAYKPGTGTAWEQAWTLKGSCTGTIAPTTLSPTTLAPTAVAWSGVGCPIAYVAGTAYVEGSTVAVGTMVYQCKVPGWCTLEAYKPGTGTAWEQAWTLKGSCFGTIAPTTFSPTMYTASPSWPTTYSPTDYTASPFSPNTASPTLPTTYSPTDYTASPFSPNTASPTWPLEPSLAPAQD